MPPLENDVVGVTPPDALANGFEPAAANGLAPPEEAGAGAAPNTNDLEGS